MAEATAEWKGPPTKAQFLGHPVGLFVLFFTEMWERFSYYGMRGLLKLYMVNFLFVTIRQTLQGKSYDGVGNPDDIIGWSFVKRLLPAISPAELQTCIAERAAALAKDNAGMAVDVAQNIATQTCSVSPNASVLYGFYTGLVYLTPVLGGLLADRYLGQRRSVFIGGILMALGQFVLFGSEASFFIGLVLLILGNGFFKPNISTQVGSLYPPGDPRRDGAFTMFYMGINLGAFICNFICGGLAAAYGWRYGFLAAGIGMCAGMLVQFLFGARTLAPDTLQKRVAGGAETKSEPLTKGEWKRVWALVILCALNIVFWAVYEQQGNTMQTWADEKTVWPNLPIFLLAPLGGLLAGVMLGAIVALVTCSSPAGAPGSETNSRRIRNIIIGGGVLGAVGLAAVLAIAGYGVSDMYQVPSTWFQSVNPLFIFLFAPFFDRFWAWQNKQGKEPSSVAKMAIGCFVLGGSFLVMVIGAKVVGSGTGGVFWPVFCTMLVTVGELYLSPIGLSLVTKVAPVRIVSLMMGLWFLSSFFGNILSGYVGQLYTTMSAYGFFLLLMAMGIAAGVAIWFFNKPLKSAMATQPAAPAPPAAAPAT